MRWGWLRRDGAREAKLRLGPWFFRCLFVVPRASKTCLRFGTVIDAAWKGLKDEGAECLQRERNSSWPMLCTPAGIAELSHCTSQFLSLLSCSHAATTLNDLFQIPV